MNNKIILCGSIFAAICLTCTSCSKLNAIVSKPEATILEETVTPVPTPEPTVEPVAMEKDDKIKSDMVEMKLKKVSFTSDVEPEYKFGTYVHYPAGEDKIYLEVKTKMTNLLEEDLACEDISTVTLRTETGESYMAFVVPETAARGLSDDPSYPIQSGATSGVRYVIECPLELEKSTEGMKLYFEFSDENVYEYTIQ